MKCPACGYHNPPGISGCARCGPVAPARAVPDTETFYPPRARDVSTGQHLRERLARAVPGISADVVAPDWSVRLHERLCFAGTVLAAFLPGLGQALQRRWSRAVQLAAGCGVLCGLFVVLFHDAASDVVLGLLLLLVMLSVGDVMAHRYPPLRSDEVDDMRAVLLGWARVALFSISVVLTAVAVGLWALGRQYVPLTVNADWLRSRFQEDDALLVERPSRTLLRGLRRGDVVTYDGERGPGLEQVLALPGDQITLGLGGFRVNGAPVSNAARTLSGGSPFSNRVPAETIAVSSDGRDGSSMRFVPFGAVRGRVIAIYQPAARRSWVR